MLKNCKECGKELAEKNKGAPKIFCDIKCQKKNYYKTHKEELKEKHKANNKKWYEKNKKSTESDFKSEGQ